MYTYSILTGDRPTDRPSGLKSDIYNKNIILKPTCANIGYERRKKSVYSLVGKRITAK